MCSINTKTKEDLSDKELYLDYCNQIDRLITEFNPCGFKSKKCRRRVHCCDICGHLTPEGCSIQSLYCKMWFCEHALLNQEIISTITDINNEIDKKKKDYFFVYRDIPDFMK